jgi:hypothetical protein
MKRQSVAWERVAEVRQAAQGWRRAGAIDEATEHAIRKTFPDPCVTPSVVWRVLTACVVAAIILCIFGALAFALAPISANRLSFLTFLLGSAALAATEVLEASPRWARRGAAGTTSFLGVGLLLLGFGIFLLERMAFDGTLTLNIVLLVSVLAWGLSGWRWGSPVFVALSAVSLFLFLARWPLGRVLWLLAGSGLAALAARRLDDFSWAPSHRRSAAVLVVAGLLAVYAAVNVYSLDQHLLENFRPYGGARGVRSSGIVALSALATALLPLAILTWGARSRRTVVLDTGIVLLALSLVTLRHYVHLAPLWVVLTLAGAALVVLALAVERTLRRAPGGEIAGFTADPLFADERRVQALQIVPVVAAFTPGAPAVEGKGFAGGGGKFGGGGASEKF